MTTGIQPRSPVDIYIRIVLLSLLIFWCLWILSPFTTVLIWSLILALALSPLYTTLLPRFGNRKGLTATILVVIGLIIIILPSFLFVDSIADGARDLKKNYSENTLTLPPPPAEVAQWPLIGEKLYGTWSSASANLHSFILENKEIVGNAGKKVIHSLSSVIESIFQFIFATIIAGVLLSITGTRDVADRIFSKLIGPRGKEFSELAQRTVNNVVKGILGVAFIQSFLIGVGFLLAGVPYAGIWTLVVFVTAILQIPAIVVVIPVAIYLFSTLSTLPAILWTIYLVMGGLSDNFLKPVLLGKGASVPMLVIFLGVVGGFITMGFIGLFIGAIILSVGYIIFESWLNTDSDS